MTDRAEDLYLGWTQLQHKDGCKARGWDVDTRTDTKHRGGRDHECPDVDCGHDGEYEAQTVRLTCRGCGVVRLYTGESISFGGELTPRYGYGQPPKKVGGLWLWPGRQRESWGKPDDLPWDYLVTADRVDRITPDNLVGRIGQGQGGRGGVIWSAGTQPIFDPEKYRYSSTPVVTYAVTSGDTTFRTPTAAARWIEANRGVDTEGDRAGTVR